MRKLNQEERSRYLEDGFVVLDDFFPVEELSSMNAEIDELERTTERPVDGFGGDHAGFLFELAMLSDRTRNFASDPRILTVIEDVVYPGIAIHSSKLVAKLPHSATVCHWHQDDAYYIRAGASDVRMSIWVPLQNSTLENGCLWVVPGSHRRGLQPYEVKESGACRLALQEKVADLSQAIPLEVKAGCLVLFSSLLWHGSKGNQTDTVRRAIIVSYQEATLGKGAGRQHVVIQAAG